MQAARAADDPEAVVRRAPRTPWEAAVARLAPRLAWRPCLRWKCRIGAHINALEYKGRSLLLRSLARRTTTHGVRVLGLCDSKTALGAAAKGRSGSKALHQLMRRDLADLLGSGVELAEFFTPTELMPADRPSRGLPVAPALPHTTWSREVLAGQTPIVTEMELRDWRRGVWRPCDPSEWKDARVLARYGLRGVRVGEASHPGPRRAERVPRPARDFTHGLDAATWARYRGHGVRFAVWLAGSSRTSVDLLAHDTHLIRLNDALVQYTEFCWRRGSPREDAEGAILHTQTVWWWTRGRLRRAWSSIRAWKLAQPPALRLPALASVTRAVVVRALEHRCPRVAVLVWIGFHGMLRPQELLSMRASHAVFIDEADPDVPPSRVALAIPQPKTRRTGAREQFVMLDEPGLLILLSAVKAATPPNGLIWNGSADNLRQRYAALQAELGVAHPTPLSGLRAGGATHHFLQWQDVGGLRLRGRWASLRTLDHYVQESTAALRGALEAPATRRRLQATADRLASALRDAVLLVPTPGT